MEIEQFMAETIMPPSFGARAARPSRLLRYCLVAVLAALALIDLGVRAQDGERNEVSARIRLGARLFKEPGFSSRDGDLISSCGSCHLYDQDPQGIRAFTDFFARSWVSWRSKDQRRDGLRNAPTILDAAELPRLHYDGEFESLEELVKGTIAGRTLGWLPGERGQALEQACRVILDDAGDAGKGEKSYRDLFKQAYGVDVRALGRDEVIKLIAGAISDYVRTLKTKRDSPYDRFIRMNALEIGPKQGETPADFSERLLARISNLETRGELRLPADFGQKALEGLKIFFTAKGDKSSGNCVSCHAPPLFTDFSFHNMGVSQSEYDRHHGDGSFASLNIPGASAAVRPSPQFREIPSRNRPGNVDLGHWNFVKLSSSPLRRAGEGEDRFLRRMIATFKTPTLRNLAYSQPYLHNGAFASLDEVLIELMRMSELARAGRVREADEGLSLIRISEADVGRLVVFLNSLNDGLR
jgi:cytochrome c peroxidase